MKQIYDIAFCVALLRQKHSVLLAQGGDRYPRRTDFTEEEVVAIKAHLGPWPRALEMAGIKPARDADGEHAETVRQRRIRQKRARRQARQSKD